MPRQNFISKEFFVNVEENGARNSLLSLIHCSQSIKFIKENTLTNSFRFLYQPLESKRNYQIDIAILPLDNSYSQINLHLSYPSGQAIHADTHIKSTLLLFEQLVYAGVKGKASEVMTTELEQNPNKWKSLFQMFNWSINAMIMGRKKRIVNL
jgi:hypothetical protein